MPSLKKRLSPRKPHSISVRAIPIHKGYVSVPYTYSAIVSAINETEVIPQISGILLEHKFVEGSNVNKGDVLFNIDSQQYAITASQAKAKLQAAQAIYDNAKKSEDRARSLRSKDILSEAEIEQVISKGNQALANLNQAKAIYEEARLNLEHCSVRAPISGTISSQLIPDGTLLAARNSVLAKITQLDNLYVDFSFSEKDYQEIKQFTKVGNLKVKIYSRSGELYDMLGVVDFTSPTIDVDTGTVKARAIVSNKKHLLMPGQFVRVETQGVNEYGFIVPEKSLMQDIKSPYIYVVRSFPKGKNAASSSLAIRINVKVIRQLENRSWLISVANVNGKANDLRDGDMVLTEGHFMVESAAVNIQGKLPGVPVNLLGSEKLDKQS